MAIPAIFDVTMGRMQYGLNGLSRRQDLIATNVANVDTTGYLAHDIPFEQRIMQAMQVSDGGIPGNLPDVITRNDMQVRNDGNNVDVNQQMTELSRTTVVFQSASQFISGKFGLLQDAIAMNH